MTNQETENLCHLLYPQLVQLLALHHWLKKRLVKNLLMEGDVNFLNFFTSLAFHFPLCMSVLYTWDGVHSKSSQGALHVLNLFCL